PVVPKERLLDDVLGVADAPEHPVGDREQERAELFERLDIHVVHLAPSDERGGPSVTRRPESPARHTGGSRVVLPLGPTKTPAPEGGGETDEHDGSKRTA